MVVPETLLRFLRRIGGEHLVTPGMGDGNPEHRLPMVAALDQLQSLSGGRCRWCLIRRETVS